ncbi:MAG: FecR domain-containing protein [Deltaproteobacteria bacterium]|uniref:FecR domain-containing protein n=1 Tax=Candidatus Zymogenus saltonus TaxID=2844893 RepID=A0A9D8PN51_9DELT|nr:FecR domain-containing protein [Candidatus Zymogenus saltonus]
MKGKKIVVSSLVSILFAALIAAPAISAGEELSGTIIDVKRDCFVTEKGTDNWINAIKGMAVSGGVRLKTGEESSMIVELNGDVIKLGPMTEIEITDFSGEKVTGDTGKEATKTSTVIGLVAGKIYSKVKELTNDSIFEIRSDISIAGSRGTVFSVDRVGENSFSTLIVLWGTVSFSSIDPKTGNPIGNPVNVGRKMSSTITSGGPAGQPVNASGKQIRTLFSALKNMEESLDSFRGGGEGGGDGGCRLPLPEMYVLKADDSPQFF